MPSKNKIPSKPPSKLRLGTRGSALARWQADWVTQQLAERGVGVEICLIATGGDVTSGPIAASGQQGVFTKEIQRALLDGQVDLAVHSLKDLPTDEVEGLVLAAVPPREKPGDALVSNVADSIESLPQAARVGTGSRRRQSQLLHLRPDLQVLDIRGNVDTRLRKLDEGQYDAIVLAEAGLRRLGLAERIVQHLAPPRMMPAVGQGALALETRSDDEHARQAVAALNDAATRAAVIAERTMLAELRGGCLAPVGGWGRVGDDGQLTLDGVVLSADGRQRIAAQAVGAPADAEAVGREVARQLLEQGAGELIAAARQ